MVCLVLLSILTINSNTLYLGGSDIAVVDLTAVEDVSDCSSCDALNTISENIQSLEGKDLDQYGMSNVLFTLCTT